MPLLVMKVRLLHYFYIFVFCIFAILTYLRALEKEGVIYDEDIGDEDIVLEGNEKGSLKPWENALYSLTQNKVPKEDQMKMRSDIMRKACIKHGIQNISINPWEYFINEQFSVVWCNVFKSGSTSWMFIMNALAGYEESFLEKTKKYPLILARKKYKRPSKRELLRVLNKEKTASVLIGRHPLERLVSAYRDKIVGAHHGTLHDNIRRNIIRLGVI